MALMLSLWKGISQKIQLKYELKKSNPTGFVDRCKPHVSHPAESTERMSFKWIETRIEGDVGIIALNRPDILNAISPPMVAAFEKSLIELTAPNSPIRCLVITGNGRAFCSGADLSGGENGNVATSNRARGVLQQTYHPFLRLLRDCNLPIVTAINGLAVGAGMSIALMGDIITCARSAYFLQAFRRIGLVPDCGSSWMLPRLIGTARARELSLLGNKLSAETALEWGMVNRVFEDETFMEETMEVARNLADGPTESLRKIRLLYWETQMNGFEEQLNLEDELQFEAALGAEHAEGKAAFLEKRPADFRKI